jgi:hypothetical protein
MYIRFETLDGRGLFHVMGDIDLHDRRPKGIPRREVRQLDECYEWLYRHTPVPPGSAYSDPLCKYPRTWFKESASMHVRMAWQLSTIVSRRVERLRPIRSDSPGVILWEDEVQAVVRAADQTCALHEPARTRANAWNGDRTTTRYGRGRRQVVRQRVVTEANGDVCRRRYKN